MFHRTALSFSLARHPAWPYVAPFAAFLAFLAIRQHFRLAPEIWVPVQVLVVSLLLVTWSRVLVALRTTRFAGSLLLGAAVFAVWIGPDLLWPEYRRHWLFQNAITGTLHSSIAEALRNNTVFLFFRIAGSVILVPIIEEIFWRAWLMRYLVSRDFLSVPLGTYAAQAFWISALLFASEHGSYWDVGLLAGVAYNWWIVRTRSLGDCILAHAVTNACLAVYVLSAGKWEYWL